MVRGIVFTILFSVCGLAHLAQARVTGNCANCHTMHNSQNGASLQSQPQNYLLADDCVGCHSSSGSETIVTLGTTRIPIVYNTTAYPAQPLAGGNFYKVAQGGAENDIYGHNVHGISGQDNLLSMAPGTYVTCTNTCHVTLTNNLSWTWYGTNGCQGCHQYTKHHGQSTPVGSPETLESGWYRFLGGHIPTRYVEGIEDPDWEQNPTSSNHNIYKGYDQFYTDLSGQGLALTKSITAFCTGCHVAFHLETGGDTNGMQSPWLRHPTDLALPEAGEYNSYNPVTDYDPDVPVAWLDPTAPIRSEAVVMCLSCHRAHGSEYPDMLRWDYDTTIANGGASSTGCFKCHSLKDE